MALKKHEDPFGRVFLTWEMQLLSGQWISVCAVHPTAPISQRNVGQWASHLEQVRKTIAARTPLLLLGDFNSTIHHAPFRKLVESIEGEVATAGVPTWPQNNYAYKISGRRIAKLVGRTRWILPLDHIILRDIQAWRVWVGQGAGSDHRPVYADISVY